MNKIVKRCFAALLALILCLGMTQTSAYADTAGVTYDQAAARSILPMINSYRTSGNAWQWDKNNTRQELGVLSELQYSYILEEIAMTRAAELVTKFDHTRPDGTRVSALLPSGWTYCGENIAMGQRSAERVHTAWMEEEEDYDGQGHRRNILDSSFTCVGIACAIDANGTKYWVEVFASGVAVGEDNLDLSGGSAGAGGDTTQPGDSGSSTGSAENHLYAEGSTPDSLKAAASKVFVNDEDVTPNVQTLDMSVVDSAEAKIRADLVSGQAVTILWAGDVLYGTDGTVKILLSDLDANGDYRLYHLTGSGWESAQGTVEDGAVSAYFSSYSPVVVAKFYDLPIDNTHYHHWADTVVKATATTWGYTMHTCECGESYVDAYVAPTSGSAAVTATSPKTAEAVSVQMMVVMFMGVAGAAAVLAAFCRRKSVSDR